MLTIGKLTVLMLAAILNIIWNKSTDCQLEVEQYNDCQFIVFSLALTWDIIS